MVNLPDSSLGNEAKIGCQLAKSNTCKKVEKMTEPKKEVTLFQGKKKEDGKKKQNDDKKKKEDAEKKRKADQDKKNKEAADKKKKEDEEKKRKNQPGACNIGVICMERPNIA